ncbi:MAG: DNA ligase D [Gemmatimonadota bacterium]
MPKRDPLSEYRAKRSGERTPEPTLGAPPGARTPRASGTGAGVFVIHKHAARRLHYDLRLEMRGVLASWAVPKGPALDPKEKRLAVHVEDHPLEYAEFEGVIPKGSYGAGGIIIWDRGVWVPLVDPMEGMEKGKLLLELRGFKLRGVWTLVKLAKSEKEWLLIRERRHMAREESASPGRLEDLPEESILSGLTVEELAAGHDPGPRLLARLEEVGATRRRVRPERVKLMLAESRERPFSRPGWLFELKFDGYRMLGAASDDAACLITRNGNDATPTFPRLAAALAALPVSDVVLDGEVVMHDEEGLPSFQRLQQRARLNRAVEIERAALLQPAVFYAFDLLSLLGHDLRSLPLSERKALLREVLPPVGPIRYVEHFAERGEELFARVRAMGLEGVVGKKADSPYRGRRSSHWLKVRADRTDDFVVVGYTAPKGSRAGFGALHLAAYGEGELMYAGRAGSGFAASELGPVRSELARLARRTPPCTGNIPGGKGHCWVEPVRVCEVRYLEWTEEGLLRQPVFVRFRDDKRPEECAFPAGAGRSAAETELEEALDPELGSRRPGRRRDGDAHAPIALTNPDKVFWPATGYTKRDLFDYYRSIAPYLLPYLHDRPLVLTRYPDGIEGKSFYQKNAPPFTRDWVRTVRIESRSSEKEIEYFVCDDETSLLYLVNLGTIPLHIWASRIGTVDRPDWCVLDLDPKGAPFANVVEIAKYIRLLCNGIRLPAFVKTSGSSGLHILIPLGRQVDYEQSRALGELLARVTVADLPEIATIERGLDARGGRVYVDYLQNRRGQLLVAPFSVRPNPGAPVSMPLRWREVNARLDNANHTIRTAHRRMSRMKEDPMVELLRVKPDLPAVLGRLQGRLQV